MPFPAAKKYVIKMWSNLGLQDITSNGHGMFIMKFKNMEDLMKTVEKGT